MFEINTLTTLEDFKKWAFKVGVEQSLEDIWCFIRQSSLLEPRSAPSPTPTLQQATLHPSIASFEGDLRKYVFSLQEQLAIRDTCIKGMLNEAILLIPSTLEAHSNFHSNLTSIVEKHNISRDSHPQPPFQAQSQSPTVVSLQENLQISQSEVANLRLALKAAKKEIRGLRRLGTTLVQQLKMDINSGLD
jgi:hypothetical protein